MLPDANVPGISLYIKFDGSPEVVMMETPNIRTAIDAGDWVRLLTSIC